jgi:hypothetical protein
VATVRHFDEFTQYEFDVIDVVCVHDKGICGVQRLCTTRVRLQRKPFEALSSRIRTNSVSIRRVRGTSLDLAADRSSESEPVDKGLK